MFKLTQAKIEMLRRAARKEPIFGGRTIGGQRPMLHELQAEGYLVGHVLTDKGRELLNRRK